MQLLNDSIFGRVSERHHYNRNHSHHLHQDSYSPALSFTSLTLIVSDTKLKGVFTPSAHTIGHFKYQAGIIIHICSLSPSCH